MLTVETRIIWKKLRIGVDLKRMNSATEREIFVMPIVDDVLHKFSNVPLPSSINQSIPPERLVWHSVDSGCAILHRGKTETIKSIQSPNYSPELRRFLGMVTSRGRYMENLATWYIQPSQQSIAQGQHVAMGTFTRYIFQRHEISCLHKTSFLPFYDTRKPTEVCADASCFGVGVVLM